MAPPSLLAAMSNIFTPSSGNRPRGFGLFQPEVEEREYDVILRVKKIKFLRCAGILGYMDLFFRADWTDETGATEELCRSETKWGCGCSTRLVHECPAKVWRGLPGQTELDLDSGREPRLDNFVIKVYMESFAGYGTPQLLGTAIGTIEDFIEESTDEDSFAPWTVEAEYMLELEGKVVGSIEVECDYARVERPAEATPRFERKAEDSKDTRKAEDSEKGRSHSSLSRSWSSQGEECSGSEIFEPEAEQAPLQAPDTPTPQESLSPGWLQRSVNTFSTMFAPPDRSNSTVSTNPPTPKSIVGWLGSDSPAGAQPPSVVEGLRASMRKTRGPHLKP